MDMRADHSAYAKEKSNQNTVDQNFAGNIFNANHICIGL